MDEIRILLLIMIIIEVYHFFYHNSIFVICRPVYNKIMFISHYKRMTSSYYSMYRFMNAHIKNKSISKFVEDNKERLNALHENIPHLPSSAFVLRNFILNMRTSTITLLVLDNLIRVLRFLVFVWLAFLLPSSVSARFVSATILFEVLHILNEKGNKMLFIWYPFIDSMFRIFMYIFILFDIITA